MNEFDAEIFAVGKWNGMTFTLDDLSAIVSAFSELGDKMRVALKLGHNDEQRMTDGEPALGWVEKIWVAGDKLMAHFVDVPDIVKNAIKKKLYKNVSVELDMDVSYKDKRYDAILTGVALLGADIPAVNTLKDLTHYMGRDAEFSVGDRAVFTAIAGQSQYKEKQMELEELTKKVTELTAELATFTAENARLKADNADLASKVMKFEEAAKAKSEAEVAEKLLAKRTEVNDMLEDGVRTEAITPAQREQFIKVLRIADDEALTALNVDDVKALLHASGKQFSREQGKSGDHSDNAMTAPEQVAVECNAMVAEGKARDFMSAQALLFQRNPKLAREYVDFNDKKE